MRGRLIAGLLYRYAEGKWLDSSQIPPDRTSWGSLAELADRAEYKAFDVKNGDQLYLPPETRVRTW
ncbi:MAG: hypothetical protein ACJ8R9_03900 [Steroidobacteraceae bacterium]